MFPTFDAAANQIVQGTRMRLMPDANGQAAGHCRNIQENDGIIK